MDDTGPISGAINGSQDSAVPSWDELVDHVLVKLRRRGARGRLGDLGPILARVRAIRIAERALLKEEARDV